jgi:hypothetical protein
VVIQEVDLHAVLPAQQLHNAGVLLPPAKAGVELGHHFHLDFGVVLDFIVVGQDQHDLVVGDPGQGRGQSLHHIAQTAGFYIRCALGC